jgi:hypothetical protein
MRLPVYRIELQGTGYEEGLGSRIPGEELRYRCMEDTFAWDTIMILAGEEMLCHTTELPREIGG